MNEYFEYSKLYEAPRVLRHIGRNLADGPARDSLRTIAEHLEKVLRAHELLSPRKDWP